MSIVDASVIISALLPPEIHHANSVNWLRNCGKRGEMLIVPAILLAEVAGPIARQTDNSQLGKAAKQFVLQLPNLRIVTLDQTLGDRAAEIAADYRLRGADAIYVAVAEHLGQPLITLDQQQLQRAEDLITAKMPA